MIDLLSSIYRISTLHFDKIKADNFDDALFFSTNELHSPTKHNI